MSVGPRQLNTRTAVEKVTVEYTYSVPTSHVTDYLIGLLSKPDRVFSRKVRYSISDPLGSITDTDKVYGLINSIVIRRIPWTMEERNILTNKLLSESERDVKDAIGTVAEKTSQAL